jgi:hypothetical protein
MDISLIGNTIIVNIEGDEAAAALFQLQHGVLEPTPSRTSTSVGNDPVHLSVPLISDSGSRPGTPQLPLDDDETGHQNKKSYYMGDSPEMSYNRHPLEVLISVKKEGEMFKWWLNLIPEVILLTKHTPPKILLIHMLS